MIRVPSLDILMIHIVVANKIELEFPFENITVEQKQTYPHLARCKDFLPAQVKQTTFQIPLPGPV